MHDGGALACLISAVAVELGGQPSMLLVAAGAPDRARTRAEIAGAVAAALCDAETITTRVLDHLARAGAAARPGLEEPALSGLPARVREVLGLVSQGLDDAAIAGRLGLSRTTVRNHVNGLYRRLAGRVALALVVWAHERGLGGPRN